MFPAECDYVRAESVDDALSTLADHGEGATLIAGGHGLLPDMKTRERTPDLLIDVDRLDDLAGVERTDGGLSVGALTRHDEIARSDRLADEVRVLAEAAGEVGDTQIRNRGTIGGNLADAESGADLPAAVLAADATLVVASTEATREVPADEFFVGHEETALDDGDLLTAVRPSSAFDGSAYVRRTHPATGYASVGVAAAVTLDEGAVSTARVAVTGATTHARRLGRVESALEGTTLARSSATASDDQPPLDLARVTADAGEGLPEDAWVGDHHISASHRRAVLSAVAERAVRTALNRATDPAQGGDDR